MKHESQKNFITETIMAALRQLFMLETPYLLSVHWICCLVITHYLVEAVTSLIPVEGR